MEVILLERIERLNTWPVVYSRTFFCFFGVPARASRSGYPLSWLGKGTHKGIAPTKPCRCYPSPGR